MTLIFKLYPETVKMNKRVKYLGQTSFCLFEIYCYEHVKTDRHRIDCCALIYGCGCKLIIV